MEESGFEFRNVAHQYFATIIANLIMVGHGCVIGWFTPTLPILMSDKTPLENGPLDDEQISWLAGINNLGALGGILTFGFITTRLGCKRAMLCLALPSIAFWLLIYFGNTYYLILFARWASGFTGGGIQTTIVLFVSEISNDNIRGRMSSLTTLSRNFGVLIMFTVGAVVDYRTIPCIFIIFPIVFVACFVLLPNTPQFYLQKGKLQEAEDSLKYYKGYAGKSQLETNAINAEFNRLKSLAKERKDDKKFRLKDLVERKAIKGISFGITLGLLAQFPGGVTFLNYAVVIFEKAGASKIDPYTSSCMLAIAQIFGCLVSTKLADSLGRKLLMISSFLGSATGLFIFSVYLYLNQNGYDLSAFSWLPVATLSFIMFIASAGVGSLYAVCFVEYLPTKIRTIGLTAIIFFLYCSAFISVKLFPILLQRFELFGCMVIFMIGSVIGSFFVIFALNETKGQSLDSVDH